MTPVPAARDQSFTQTDVAGGLGSGTDGVPVRAWEGGLYQAVDLRPLLGRITSPTLIVASELDFICGPAQAQPIADAMTGSRSS